MLPLVEGCGWRAHSGLFSPGFCRLVPHARSPGTWTIYFEGADYESHLLRENTELASIVRVQDAPEKETYSLGFENWMQSPSSPAGNTAVMGRL